MPPRSPLPLILIAASVLPGIGHAEPQWFVGGSIGHAVTGYEEKRRGDIEFTNDGMESSGGLGLRFGLDRHDTRSYLSLHALPQANATIGLLTASHDWFFVHDDLRPFLGLSVGVAALSWEDDDPFNTGETWELGGTAYSGALGGRAGVVADLNDQLSIEAGAAVHWVQLQTDATHEGDAYEIEVESAFALMGGISYRF